MTIAVANGDLSRKITVDVRGEILQLKEAINTMVDQLRSFASEVTRVAREVGTEGKLGGQAIVPGVAGTWKDLTDNVNSMASNLTGQVRNIAEVSTAIARGDLSRKITVDVKGEILELKNTINTMVDQLQLVRVRSDARGARSRYRRQARRPGRTCPASAASWKDLTDNVNSMASNLTGQVRNIADVATAIAGGDLSRKITVDVRGEILQLKETINTMVDQLRSFASEVTRVAREVGTEGKLGGQANVPGVGGTWKDLTDNVNSMASNLTGQVRNIAEVSTAIARGDLSRKITVDVKGEILQLKEAINTMVDQLNAFASEVTRVAREVGTEGKLGGQAEVKGVSGVWKDLTDNVNSMASNLTGQVRNIADVATAIANGDLSRKITVDVRGEIRQLKETINTMVDQLNAFAAEVTRVAREVGSEGKLGGQAEVKDVSGVWKDLTDNVNSMASNLTGQVRNIAEVATAIARGDLTRKITVDVRGEILQLKETMNTMVDQLNSFAAEVTRVAREVGTEGKLGGQAIVPGVAGTWKDLTDNVNSMASNLTGQVRNIAEVSTAIARGDLSRKITVDVTWRNPAAERDHQHDGRPAQRLRGRSDARGARSRYRRQARRPGAGARRRRHVEGSHRQRQHDGEQPDEPGARHREGRDRGRQRRAAPAPHGGIEGRSGGARRYDQQHDRHARDVRRPGDVGRARGRRRRPSRRPGERARRVRHVEGPHGEREPARGESHDAGARHRRSRHRRDQGRPHPLDSGRRARRGVRAQGQHQRDDRQPARHDGAQHRAGLAEDQPREVQPHDAGPARPRDGRPDAAGGAGAAGERAAEHRVHHGLRRARADAEAARQLRRRSVGGRGAAPLCAARRAGRASAPRTAAASWSTTFRAKRSTCAAD